MEKITPNIAPALGLLLEEMKASGWTNEAMEYIGRTVNCHEELLSSLIDAKNSLLLIGYKATDDLIIDLNKTIAKAEGK